mgnify:FL=1
MINKHLDLKTDLFSNMWKPLLLHTSLQLSWLVIQIRFEFPLWLFYSVMVILFGLFISWPRFEKKRFND